MTELSLQVAAPTEKKMSAKKTRQTQKAKDREAAGLVVRGKSIPVYARTREGYHRICDYIHWNRRIARHAVSVAVSTLGATSRIARIELKSPGEIKSAKTRQKHKAEKAAAKGETFEPEPIPDTKLVVRFDYDKLQKYLEQFFGPTGRKPWYAFRPYIMAFMQNIADEGGPVFSSHMWDTLRDRLDGMVNAKMPDYNEAPRAALILSARLDNIRCSHMGMSVLCAPDSNAKFAWVHERGEELFITLQAGRKEDRFDLVAHGAVVDFGAKKSFTPKLNPGDRRMLHKLAIGEWQLATPTLNLNDDGRLFLQLPHVRDARRGNNFERLDKTKVLDVAFKFMHGYDLPRRKKDTGKNDAKDYVIHCFLRDTSWVFRVPVNDVVADMKRNSAQQGALERRRDCRRKWRRGLVKPLRERVHKLTMSRTERQLDAIHAWTRWIANMADRWLCGTIRVFGPPDGASEGLLLDGSIPWQWGEFTKKLTYKAKEMGMVVETEAATPGIIDELLKGEEEAVATENAEENGAAAAGV